jgi:hypothetical protein
MMANIYKLSSVCFCQALDLLLQSAHGHKDSRKGGKTTLQRPRLIRIHLYDIADDVYAIGEKTLNGR